MSSARCQRSRLWISVRLDGALTELESVVLAHHLRKCPSCARFAENAAASTELLRAADPIAPLEPVVLPTRVARQRRLHVRPRRAFAVATAGLAAAAAALAVGTGQIISSGGEPSVQATSIVPNDSLGVPRVSLRRPISHVNFIRGDVGIPS